MPIAMTLLIRTFICLLVFFLVFDGAALAQGRRIALVIGVSKYKNVPPLANTANDADGVGAALRRLGFAVDLVIDPDRNAMESSMRNLGRKAEGAEASVFFYAGHAIEVGGQNLLVPAPADIQSDRDLRYETIDLDSVLDAVAGRSAVSLLFLDSCRDNPFSKKLVANSRAISFRGLGAIDAATGTLIAFATAPGKTAEDGDGARTAHSQAPSCAISSGPASRCAGCLARSGAKCGRRPRVGRYLGKIPRWRANSISSP